MNNVIDCIIVNYNTSDLTNSCIKSLIHSNTPCNIWVFDNSDEEKLQLCNKSVRLIDNTQGQIINFEELIYKYRSRNKSIKAFGSAKHSKTIDTLFDVFPNGFIHLDSDTIVKQNLTYLWDPDFIVCGKYVPPKEDPEAPWRIYPRIAPWVMYVNVPMCKEHNIRFFDPYRNAKLTNTPIMDTGASFYQDIKKQKLPIKLIDDKLFVKHLLGGSHSRTEEDKIKFINKNSIYL
jgi:hypothetical protein